MLLYKYVSYYFFSKALWYFIPRDMEDEAKWLKVWSNGYPEDSEL